MENILPDIKAPGFTNTTGKLHGLTTIEQNESRRIHGTNGIEDQEEKIFLLILKEIILEPMFILLVVACVIYLFAGEYSEGTIMGIAVFIVAGISLFQEYRSRNAVNALKKISSAKASVIRAGSIVSIPTEEIVVNDLLLLSEGEIVAADGIIIIANDLSLNEAVLTGEAFSVSKAAGDNTYKGTLVTSGSATVKVNAVGTKTMFGKIGVSLKEITILKTPLQKQISHFVRSMAWIGLIAFLFVVIFNYYRSADFLNSLIRGLTLAMSVLPEEIPVAFSTFMALGAFRLLRNNVIVKQPQYVETLGTATVICTDKTGTLTLNSMTIEWLYDAVSGISINTGNREQLPLNLIEYAMWASETDAFDPMEKSIHNLYKDSALQDKRTAFVQVHEYPISGKPPMMTHIFKNSVGEVIIAAKGSPEALLAQSNLSVEQIKKVEAQSVDYAKRGYRILGVGKASWAEKKYPVSQQEFSFEFLGLIAFQDPPKKNMKETIQAFNNAGINVKMITGDYAQTACAIAGQINLSHSGNVLTGDEIVRMEFTQLKQKVNEVNIFARMYPEAKLKVIEALIDNGEIVAMTGDGVNDAPALKAAHIGIAMGLRGSEVAKASASLILADDDLSHMVQAVEQGRKIYDNLKKAIQYIVSIHIPIILIVVLPLLLGWAFTDIFTPVHVIFLELIMGPTCSIIYENEPVEPGTMMRPPRKIITSFLSGKQLLTSITQGVVITIGCLGIGYFYIADHASQSTVRTIIFITLLFSNIFLSFLNRSFHYSILKTIRYKNNLLFIIAGISLLCLTAFLFIPSLQQLFGLTRVATSDILISVAVAFVATCWIELFKK